MRRSMPLVTSAKLGRSCRRAVMAASVLVPLLFLATQASAEPAGCDPSRPGVTHGADASNVTPANVIPCITYGFMGFGEANVAVSPDGAVMYGGAYDPNPQPADCVVGAYEISSSIARSTDKGATWDFVDLRPTNSPPPPDPSYPGPPFGPIPEGCRDAEGTFPQSRGAGDPRLWVDPLTDTIWFTNIGNSLGRAPFPSLDTFDGLCQTEISTSKDGGATWENDPDPVGFGCPRFDFPHLLTAPPPPGTKKGTGSWPNIVYLCKSTPIPTDGRPSALCWRSRSGMKKIEELPDDTAALGLRRATGGLDGTLYGVTIVSGFPHLSFSTDQADSWTVSTAAIPVSGRGVAVDRDGNVYSAGISPTDNKPYVTYSTDKGEHWSVPVAVQAPGVGHAHDVSIAVPVTGPPGPLAVVYIGSDAPEDDPANDTLIPNALFPPFTFNRRSENVHNGYLATTNDIFAANPVFQSVQVDSDAEPILPYGFPVTGNTTTSGRGDYIGVTFDEGPAEQISEVLAFFDQAMADGDLVGTGTGSPNALRNMLTTASGQIGGGTPWGVYYKDVCPGQSGTVNIDEAICDFPIPGVTSENPHPMWTNWLGTVGTVDRGECGQLRSARSRTDGNPKPPDFVQGSAASDLEDQIEALIERQCG